MSGVRTLDHIRRMEYSAASDVIAAVIRQPLWAKDKLTERLMGSSNFTPPRPMVGTDYGKKWIRPGSMEYGERATYYADNVVRMMADRMVGLGRFVDEIKRNGGSVLSAFDAYAKNDLMIGKTFEELEAFGEKTVKPTLQKMHEMGMDDAVTMSDLKKLSTDKDHNPIAEYLDHIENQNNAVAGLYAMAKHVPERNLVMKEINPRGKAILMPGEKVPLMWVDENGVSHQAMHPADALSGMSTPDAMAVIQYLENHKNADKLKEVYDGIREIVKYTNEVRVRGELIPPKIDFEFMDTPMSQAFRDAALTPGFEYLMKEGYRNYVPLRGFAADPEGMSSYTVSSGRGFQSRRREDLRGLGRASMAGNVVEHAVLQAQEAVIRANKAEVGRAFLKLLEENKDLGMMSNFARIVDTAPLRWVLVDGAYRLESLDDDGVPLREKRDAPHTRLIADEAFRSRVFNDEADPNFLVKRVENGVMKEYVIEISNYNLMRAMKGATGQGASTLMMIVNQLGKVTRFLANTVTTWNPEFMFGNFQRDITDAMLSATQFEVPDLSGKIMKNAFPAMRAIWGTSGELSGQFLSGKGKKEIDVKAMSPEQQRYVSLYKDFLDDGGSIASMGLRDLADTIAHVNRHFHDPKKDGPMRQGMEFTRRVGDFVEGYNRVVENATRLSVYISLREALEKQIADKYDSSPKPELLREARDVAAQAAKNLTANFNRGGEWKPAINSLWMFYNASIQGTFGLASAARRSSWARGVIGAAVLGGFLHDQMQSMLSERDESGALEFDKLKDWQLEHKMVFMDPTGMTEGGYIGLLLPYGYSAFSNFGRSVSRYLRGGYDAGEAAGTALGGIVNAFNPISGANSLLNFAAPTVVDPIMDIYQNKNFQGRPIAKEPSSFGVQSPQHSLYWNNTSAPSIEIAEFLNWISGGSAGVSGAIDMSPDVIDYMAGVATGGAGKLVARVLSLGDKAYSGEMGDLTANDIPLARQFIGNVGARDDTERYMQLRQKVLQPDKAARAAAEAGDVKQAQEIRKANADVLRVAGVFRAADSARSKLSTQLKKIRDSAVIPEDRKAVMVKRIKDLMAVQEMRAVKAYNRINDLDE
jgi:hypothetical protein